MNVPWTAASGAEIGADWLETAIAPAGEFGRRARRGELAFRPGDEAAARNALQDVARAARALEAETLEALRGTLAAVPDPGNAVSRAAAGGVLADADFFELVRFLDGLQSLAELANALPPALAVPDELDDVRAALAPGRLRGRTFYLEGAFDSDLAAARNEAAARRAGFDAALSRRNAGAARALGVDHLRAGEFVVMRDQLRGPLPPGVRVLREARTYVLCELALDEATLLALGEAEMAERRVAELEERVRARLSERVRAAAERLNAACAALGALDSFLGRVRFARRYDAVVPEITAGGAPAFEAARYLPLEEALSERDRRYEPISLELDVAGVITGPNMGGKTAALRLCGFLAACVALGVPVPARRARLPLFAEVAWLGFGAPAEDEGLLSAFGAEVVEVRAFFERGANPALVLIDEFARTTAPREGRALLVALLECLRNAGNVALAATHLSDVAEAAGATHYAIAGLRELTTHEGPPLPLETALRRIAERMDYRIRRVAASTPDASDALALAAILGLDRELIERARRLL